MRVHQTRHIVPTQGRGFFDVTPLLHDAVAQARVTTGICTAFLHHTSASLLVTENADPDVRRDLEAFFAALVRDGDPRFRHDAEGPDDMPAHVRAALTQTSLALPIVQGRAALGTWQGLYVYEHRHAPHRRQLTLTTLGV